MQLYQATITNVFKKHDMLNLTGAMYKVNIKVDAHLNYFNFVKIYAQYLL